MSTGKEANVCFATTASDPSSGPDASDEYSPNPKQEAHDFSPNASVAFKVFKTSILQLKDRERYVVGEFRFRGSDDKVIPTRIKQKDGSTMGEGVSESNAFAGGRNSSPDPAVAQATSSYHFLLWEGWMACLETQERELVPNSTGQGLLPCVHHHASNVQNCSSRSWRSQ